MLDGISNDPKSRRDGGPRIDAVVLTLNEEESISRCLSSLGWCHAVHVVDSGSTDATRQISEAAGANVYVHRQAGPFLITEQRNWALRNIESEADWILFLDADEVCTDDFERGLRSSIESVEGVDAFYAAPAFHFHGKWIRRTSGYPNWHPRVVRRSLVDPFEGGVWETFRVGVSAAKASEPYVHFPNSKGASAWFEKHLRYAQHEAESIVTAPPGGAARRQWSRAVRYRLGPFRKIVTIFYLLLWRRGILDGPTGWRYIRRMYQYELFIDALLSERRRLSKGGEL